MKTRKLYTLMAAGAMMLAAGCSEQQELATPNPQGGKLRWVKASVRIKPPTDEVETRMARAGRGLITRMSPGTNGAGNQLQGNDNLHMNAWSRDLAVDGGVEAWLMLQKKGRLGTFEGEILTGRGMGYIGIVGNSSAAATTAGTITTDQVHKQDSSHFQETGTKVSNGGTNEGNVSVTTLGTGDSIKTDTTGNGNVNLNISTQNVSALVEGGLEFPEGLEGEKIDQMTLTSEIAIATEATVALELPALGRPGVGNAYALVNKKESQRVDLLKEGETAQVGLEGRYEFVTSFFGGQEVENLVVECVVEGKTYSTTLYAGNTTLQSGKVYQLARPAPMVDQGVLNIKNAGDLAAEDDAYAVLDEALTADGTLALSGSPNADDLSWIRVWAREKGTLKTLDLSRTEITETPERMMWAVTSLEKAILPASLTDIRDGAFEGCTALHTVEAPGLKKIHHSGGVYGGAFQNCTQLTQIDLGKVEKVGERAFQGCTALAAIDLLVATFIDIYAFDGCTALQTANLPKVKMVNAYAFQGCTRLEQINCSDVKSVGGYAFWDCTALKSIDLSQATTLDSHLFQGCTALAEIQMTANQFESINSNIFLDFPNIGNATLIVNEKGEVNESGKWQYRMKNGTTWEIDVSGFKCVKADLWDKVLWPKSE